MQSEKKEIIFPLEPKLVGLENDILGFQTLGNMEYEELQEIVQGHFCLEWPMNYCLDFWLEKRDGIWFWEKVGKESENHEEMIKTGKNFLGIIYMEGVHSNFVANIVETAMEIKLAEDLMKQKRKEI